MKTGINKLDEYLDQIVIWLRENRNIKITAPVEERASLILKRIAGLSKLSNTEFENLVRKVVNITLPNSQIDYTKCDACGATLKLSRVGRHSLVCPKIIKTKIVSGIRNSSIKANNKPIKARGYLNNPYLPDYKAEHQMDGAKDFYQFRDQGKFGSYSSFDDYDDKSFA